MIKISIRHLLCFLAIVLGFVFLAYHLFGFILAGGFIP